MLSQNNLVNLTDNINSLGLPNLGSGAAPAGVGPNGVMLGNAGLGGQFLGSSDVTGAS